MLEVKINSTKPIDSEGQKLRHMPFEYAHTRKAAYQYSWDWAPYMNTEGIWLPVSLHLFEDAKFDYIWFRDKSLTPSTAILDIVVVLNTKITDFSQNPIDLAIERLDTQEVRRFTIPSKYTNT